jgi:hypothetical protein
MRHIETLDALRIEAERLGLGVLGDDELGRLKKYHDLAVEMSESLHSVDTTGEEPATVFKAGTPS